MICNRVQNPRQECSSFSAFAGFTLIELAIVLFIITLLLGGVLTPLGQQIVERQNGEARRALDAARLALVGYALRSPDQAGPLPCPDVSRLDPDEHASSDMSTRSDDGIEDRQKDGSCLSQTGNLPWKTLDLAELDAWGNRLGYAVSQNWSDADRHALMAVDSTLTLCTKRRCSSTLAPAAILISYGRNGFGAINGNGTRNIAPTSSDELENSNRDHRFYMLPPRAADHADGEFDDLVLPLSSDWLRGRLCDPAAVCTGGRSGE
jgi:type II secretory pathway pseudopilin PulG